MVNGYLSQDAEFKWIASDTLERKERISRTLLSLLFKSSNLFTYFYYLEMLLKKLDCANKENLFPTIVYIEISLCRKNLTFFKT